jgi:hypothetical protein
MIKLSLASIQSVAAPVLVPFTPAMLLGNEIYTVLFARTGFWMALVAGVTAAIGLEFIGGSTCYAAVKLYRRRDWWALLFAIGLVGVYMSAGIGSILYIDDTKARVLAIFFVLTPVAYIAYALVHDIKEEDDHEATQNRLQVELMEAKTKQLNAEARLEKARTYTPELVYPASFGKVFGQNEQNEQTEHQAKIFAELDGDSTIGPREMSRRVGCAPSTAKTHIDKWKALNGSVK